jgi:hypothetical protein
VRELSSMLAPCRYCLRLTDADVCRECLDHKQTSGHFPSEVFWRQIPGQPRAVTRFCGKCGVALKISYEI